MDFATALSFFGGFVENATKAYEIYGKISAVLKGEEKEQNPIEYYLRQVADKGIKIQVEHLSDQIMYARDVHAVQDVSQNRQRYVDDLREIRESLEPIQRSLKAPILSSAIIMTPEKLQHSMHKNPWSTLVNICPVHLLENPLNHSNPNMVPVMFSYQNIPFIGWQFNNILNMTLDCDYDYSWERMSPSPTPLQLPRNSNVIEIADKIEENYLYYQDGRRYEGEVRHGRANGRGLMIYPDGGHLYGYWKDDEYSP